jgi:hypothetical protein
MKAYINMHGELDPLNSVPTSQRAHCNHFKKTNQLMLVREIITVYCENHKIKIHFVSRMQSYLMLKQAVHIETTVL